MINKRVFALFVAGLLLAGVTAFAQTTATLTGTVTSDKAPLPGATVTISSPAMQGTRTDVTGPNGDYNFSPAYAPPDTVGAVGDTQYVQWVNVNFAVFDKVTGSKTYGPVPGNTLWQGFGGGYRRACSGGHNILGGVTGFT